MAYAIKTDFTGAAEPRKKHSVKPATILNAVREIFSLLLLVAAAVLFSANGKYRSATLNGISLWAATVLPALFPYLVITALISSLKITETVASALSPVCKKLFGVNGNVGYALFLSLISGYPVGAKIVAELKSDGFISHTEAQRAAALCSSSSPAFLIGSVGGLIFNDRFFGLCLFITHLVSVFAVGFVFSFYKRKDRPTETRRTPSARRSSETENDALLYRSVYSSVISALVVGGIITVFYVITEMLADLNAINPVADFLGLFIKDEKTAYGAATGLFECTKGIKIIAESDLNFFTLPVCAALCGFGGVSVIAQSLAYLKKAKIKTAPFLLSKTLAALINFCIGSVFSLIFFF
ncbi:MAG: hypothetical protein IJU83_01260 [Clostridia bacterium]|nr:hypothetical protein [Clostridia bacterium]